MRYPLWFLGSSLRLLLTILVALQLSAATVYYIPGYGESTSIGSWGCSAISTTQPYSNQMLNSGQTAFVPLVESSACTGLTGVGGTEESPLSSAMNNLTQLTGGSYVVIANNYGAGSQTITDLSKVNSYNSGAFYSALLAGVTQAKNIAGAAGNTLVVPGILFTEGANDFPATCHGCSGIGQNNYKALNVAFQAQLETDIKAITGQTQHVVIFYNQQNLLQMVYVNGIPYPASGATMYQCPDTHVTCVSDPTGQAAPLVPQAQYELARDYPALFYFFGPDYHLNTADGYVHLDAVSYNHWGATAAHIMKRVLVDGITSEQGTIMPRSGQITISGNVITLPVTTPGNLPLTIDTTTLPVPYRNGAADPNGMGFQVFQYTSGTDTAEIPISSVAVAGQTVTITLSTAPAKAHVRLAYAFEGQGGAGSPVAGCAYNATTCTVNGVSGPASPWQGNLHGNIRTTTDFTDIHGEAIQYWMPTFNESVSTPVSVSGPSSCKQGQICNYTATGGTSPYTYSLVTGSVGAIDSGTGAYTAPAHVVPKQVINGCQAFPNNSVFNTRIDALPVHPDSNLWMSNVDVGVSTIGGGMRLNGSTVLSTDPATTMSFVYSAGLNGSNFIFPPFPDRVSEEGGALTPPGMLPGDDNHFLVTYRDTCMLQEAYKLYQTGVSAANTAANSASGLLTSLESHRLQGYGYGTDAAGMPISPLLYHQDELIAAEAGNLDAIRHATRLTLDAASIASGQHIWPAQADSSGSTCQGPPSGGHTWTITGNGTTTVTATTGHGFKLWPAGTTVVIDSVNYTVVSVSVPDSDPILAAAGFYLSMVVSSVVSSGTHSMIQTDANCPPYGTRFRLKASFTWPHQWTVTGNGTNVITTPLADPFVTLWPAGRTVTVDGTGYTIVSVASGTSMTVSALVAAGSHTMTTAAYLADCDTACQNVVQAVIRQQKTYGLIVADAGSSWSGGSADIWNGSYSIAKAAEQISCNPSNCLFNGLIGNANNYEIVDESSLQTSQTASGTDSTWVEARLGNGYVTPDSAVVVKVSDSAGAAAYYSPSLQGVAVGVEHSSEIVMAGASPFQLHPWVTGAADGTFTCSLSPSGGANGSITSGCLYSPPSAGAVSTLTRATVTVTPNADNTVSKTIAFIIVPVSADGNVHISLGKALPSASYTDTAGIVWWNDQAQSLALAMTPDDSSYGVSYGGPWTNYPGTTGYATTAPQLFTTLMGNNNDHHFRIHVPNGLVAGSVLPANVAASAQNMEAFSFDCNGTTVIPQTDLYDWTGGLHVVRPMTCSQVVNDGVLHMVVRLQGVNLSPAPGTCAIPCYRDPNQGNWIAGLVVSATGVPLAYKKVTVCASGCNYPLTDSGLYTAMVDAAAYQDHTACIPYIIQGTGTVQMSGIPFPPKTCNQYVEIRSSQGSHFAPGQRYNPAADDAYAFGIQGAKLVGSPLFNTNGGTHYWRFRNVNFFTNDSGGATYPVTNATWSGGIATLTLGGNPSITMGDAVAINGITPAQYNLGNTSTTWAGTLIAVTANTISYPVANNPGTYLGGGTVTLLFNHVLSSFIQYGNYWDNNSYPDHLEIIQCGMRADGDGDVYHALSGAGDNIRIVDSYLGGFAHPSSDTQDINIFGGDALEIRNNYLSAVDENFGVGGTHVAGGIIPRFEYFYGNEMLKEPWMGMMHAATGPGTMACFEGRWFHNDTTNLDYLCSAASGVWIQQANLLTKVHKAPKNLWECKICQGVRMIGNDFGMIPGQTGQSATGIVLNLVSQPYGGPCTGGIPSPCDEAQNWTTIADFTVQANRFHDGFTPFAFAYSDPSYKPCAAINPATGLPFTQPCYNYGHHNLIFTHNLIANTSDERGYCPSQSIDYCIMAPDCANNCGSTGAVELDNAEYDIDISNNTQTTSKFSAASGLTLGFGGNMGGSLDFSGMIHVRNNIGPVGVEGFAGGADGPTGIVNPQNGCGMEAMFQLYGGALDLHKNILTFDNPSVNPPQTWQSFTTGTVTPACATAAGTTVIWPTDHAGGFSWTSILDPATFKINNPAYSGWGTDQRDPGANIDFVNWKTEHAVDGAPAPKLDYAIRSVIPTRSSPGRGVQVHFTAPSTDACTWELSTDPNLYASPVAVSSQARNGRDGLAVWNNGTLTAGTAYWLRLTCGGDQLETLVNGARVMAITAP
jgi:hypothetical protein